MPVPAILFTIAGLAFLFAAYWSWSRGKGHMDDSRRKLLAGIQLFAGIIFLITGAMNAGLIA